MRIREIELKRQDRSQGRPLIVTRRPRKGPGGVILGNVFTVNYADKLVNFDSLECEDFNPRDCEPDTSQDVLRTWDKFLGGGSPMAEASRHRQSKNIVSRDALAKAKK